MKHFIHTLLIIIVATITCVAQEVNLFEAPNTILGGLNEETVGVVGAIGGTVDVSALGGATYTIPIQVPEGIQGIQPNLSIVYNSQSGNGLLGWGWDLGGLSAITRTGSTLYHDGQMSGVNFSQDDRFLLDGQRLIDVQGDYGKNGTEYRTEVDGMTKIVSIAEGDLSPSYFKVWMADGKIAYYGNTTDSKVQLQETDNVCIWLLNRVEDRDGNYMSYHYITTNSSYRLDRIKYTGNVEAGLGPVFIVQFNYYKDSNGNVTRYNVKEKTMIGANDLNQNALLESIDIKKRKSNTLVTLYNYDFSYLTEPIYNNNPCLYERLDSINLTFYDIENGTEYHYNSTIVNRHERPIIHNSSFPNANNEYLTKAHYYYNGHERPEYVDNKEKFTGDFNGDGLSDLLCIRKVDGPVQLGLFYKNSGNTITESDPGNIKFDYSTSLHFSSALAWVYCIDITNDGLDDLITLIELDKLSTIQVYKSVLDDNGDFHFDELSIGFNSHSISIVHTGRQSGCIMVGDFLGRGRNDFIYQTKCKSHNQWGSYNNYIYFTYTNQGDMERIHYTESTREMEGTVFTAADFNNDGITEIWYASEDEDDKTGKLARITGNGTNYEIIKDTWFDAYSTIFPADFNGDGHTDVLLYHSNDNRWKIRICGSPNTHGYFYYDITDIIGNYYAGNPGCYEHNLKKRREGMNYFIETVDFNGDGKSDIVCRNATNFTVFFGPLDSSGGFMNTLTEVVTDVGLYTALNYCIICGRFLGNENTSLLNNGYLYSLPPLSTYYNISSIIDGMGNKTEFEFDYLVNNPRKDNNIYTLDHDGEDRSKGIFAIALPLKAVKKTTSYNVSDPMEVNAISEYTYKNVLVHRKGKGILGLTGNTVERYINGSLYHNYAEHSFNVSMMGEHCALMPSNKKTFLKKVENGHLKLITETTFFYDKHVHTKNSKVFMPLLTDQTTDFYDIYHQENGLPTFMKRTILHNDYGFWSGKNVIDYKNHYFATTTNQSITNYQNCEFLGNWGYDSFENDINNWLIQRPVNVGVGNGQLLYEDIYYYDPNKPHQLKALVRYPQQHYASEYATRTDYTYDAAGNIKTETLSEENGNNLKPRKTEYFYRNYRLLKTKREWLDENAGLYYDTDYDYDPYFDYITEETNCRGQITQFDQDPLGIECSTISPNGIETHTQTGWLSDNTGYYQWTYTQGSSPTLTTYDMTGRVHKVETYGFNENQLIVKNYYYNNLGQLEKEEDAHCNDEYIPTTTYYYDNYGALRKTIYPNGNTTRIKHDDEDRFKILTETTTDENEVHTTAQKTNAIGQVVTSWDEANNSVSYTYTLDGLLETATVNNDPSTTITIEYDEARNRIRLHDPDYCGNGDDLVSTYDAFGQLKTTKTPKGDITSYDYDAFGRTTTRTEGNNITQWFYYDSEPQFKGLLKTVCLNEGQEKTTYEYDPGTRRLIFTLETINDITYNPTKYSYNDLGKIETIRYPSGIKIVKKYTSTGHLLQIMDDEGDNLWTTEEKNGMGQVTLFSTGENTSALHGDYKYYKKTHFLENQLVKDKKENTIHHFWYKYDKFSNLERRTTDIYWISESFQYDELNRLEQSLVKYRDNEYISDIDYDDNDFGCIKSKTAAYDGAPSIASAEYGLEGRPHAIRTANMDIEAFPTAKLETQYTSFDKLSSIIQYDDNGEIDRSLSYQYGYDHQRIYMVESDGQDVIRTKTYLGNCEYISENGENKVYTYLTGPLGLFAVYEQTESQGQVTNEKLHYIFTDHLGSITTIVDDRGNVEQRLSYDAWGNLRNAKTWCSAFAGTPMLDRGFTGHEHLYAFGLINMNGRMYDPILGSFLSPDNYIQSPENSQSFNRYAYCMNNPLKYTDPDGEYWHLVIGALVGGTANVLANLKHIENFGQGLAYFGIGALAGGLSAGIGAGVGAAYAGGSFAAGFLGTTVQAAPCALGFAGGFSVGASSGFVSASITASGNKWMQNGTFSEGLLAGVKYGLITGAIGGLVYGSVSAFAAASKGFHPGTGQQYIESSYGNRRMPIVRQNGKNNCMAADIESMSTHKGDLSIVTQDDVRSWFPNNTDGPLNDNDVIRRYCEATGREYLPYATADNPKLTVSYEEIKHDMLWEPNSDFMISRRIPGQSIGHEVNMNRVVERSYKTLFGGMKTDYFYEVMDPYYGGYRFMSHDALLKSTNLFKIR